jgi:hypothetical protein
MRTAWIALAFAVSTDRSPLRALTRVVERGIGLADTNPSVEPHTAAEARDGVTLNRRAPKPVGATSVRTRRFPANPWRFESPNPHGQFPR